MRNSFNIGGSKSNDTYDLEPRFIEISDLSYSDDSYDFSVIMTPLSVIYKFVYFRCEKTGNLCVSGVPLSNIFPR